MNPEDWNKRVPVDAETVERLKPIYEAFLLGEAKEKDNPEASRLLLQLIAQRLGSAGLSSELMGWLRECLSEAAKVGGSFDRASGLVKKGPRKGMKVSENCRWRNRLIGSEVQALVDDGHRPYRNEATKEKHSAKKHSACSIVADRYKDMPGLGEKSIEGIYRAFVQPKGKSLKP